MGHAVTNAHKFWPRRDPVKSLAVFALAYAAALPPRRTRRWHRGACRSACDSVIQAVGQPGPDRQQRWKARDGKRHAPPRSGEWPSTGGGAHSRLPQRLLGVGLICGVKCNIRSEPLRRKHWLSALISANFCNGGDGLRASIQNATACRHGGRPEKSRSHNRCGAEQLMIFMLPICS